MMKYLLEDKNIFISFNTSYKYMKELGIKSIKKENMLIKMEYQQNIPRFFVAQFYFVSKANTNKEALKLGTRVLVIDKGKIIQAETLTEIVD